MSILLDFNYANQLTGRLERFKWIRPMLGVCRCPMCGDSSKKESKRRFYIYQDTKRGANYLSVDCKNCGYSNPFGKFLEEYDTGLYQAYRMEKYKDRYGPRKARQPDTTHSPIAVVKVPAKRLFKDPLKGCTKLSQLPATHPAAAYMRSRLLPDEHMSTLWYTDNFAASVAAFTQIEDLNVPKDARIVIPFYDEAGELIVVQGRAMRPNAALRYVTIKKTDASKKIFGLDRVNRARTVMVVEGPLDSLFLPNCVASADSDLLGIGFGDIFIPDKQPRNREICARIEEIIKAGKRVCLLPDTVVGKDINEILQSNAITRHDLLKLIASNIYQGLSAQLAFAKWKKC